MIDSKKIYSYFKERFALGKSSNGWYPLNCPYCDMGRNKKKFAIKFTWERCKCFECEYRGHVVDVVMDLEEVKYLEAKRILNGQQEAVVDLELFESFKKIEKSNVLLPKGYNSILSGDTVLGNRARKYLADRGFNLEVLDLMGFGYCDEQDEDILKDYFGYIIMPFKRKGMLQYYIGRYFLGETKMKYKNPATEMFGIGKADILYNEDALDLYDNVFVQEGYFDSMIIGRDCIATLGWSLSSTQKNKMLTSDVKKFVFIPDKGYYKKAVKTAMDFLDYKEVVVVNMDNVLPEYPDKKDVNEIGKDFVMAEYKITPQLTESKAFEIIMN